MGIENPVHLLFIAAVALIVLGPKRLPALAKALGQAMREFRASLEEGSSHHAGEIEPPQAGPAQQPGAEPGPPPADAA